MSPIAKCIPALAAAVLLLQGCATGESKSEPAATLPPTVREAPRFAGASALEWSTRMADSERTRNGDRMFRDANPKAKWSYTTPLLGLSMMRLADHTGDDNLRAYGARTVTSFIGPDGTIQAYSKSEYNIDLVAPGKVLTRLWEQGDRSPAVRAAIEELRDQMRKHPRTTDGGFWHKQRYPSQMWLDGLFMASPFLSHYARLFGERPLHDDVVRQIILMDRHAWNAGMQLHHHAWDESRAQPWANRETGRSPGFWSRAVGWYAMALVDSLEQLPADHPDLPKVHEILNRVASGIARWQDPETGLWWQVTDQGSRKGNYLEGTASSMFVYSLARGINQGVLSREKYLPVALKGYDGIIRRLIRTDADGTISLTQCCEVAGLGGTGKNGHPRDGSFEYYISEPIIDNDHKGVGPFISIGVEMDLLFGGSARKAARAGDKGFTARGWQDYEAALARIQAPTFPDRDFSIVDFGAQVDAPLNTAAIAAAIRAANAAGGGRVVVPAGVWRTGAIHLLSNVNLHVSRDATLLFSTNPADYPIVHTRWEGVELMNYSALIYAFEQKNIAVTGAGTLDGGSTLENWWRWNRKGERPQMQKAARDRLVALAETSTPVSERVFGDGSFLRPNFIQPYRCTGVLIEGLTILRSPMWVVHPVFSQNVTVRGLTITSHGGNNDGCNPESSQDVLIENCTFDTGDDCIAIKSGRNGDGRRVPVPSSNIIVRNCTMKDGHGGVVLGSECSGHIRNVFVENCTMDSPELDRALRFKNNAVRGGILENVFMRDVRIGKVVEAVVTIDLLYEEGADGAHMPTVRNVQLERVEASAAPRLFYIRGFDGAVIEDIRVKDSVIKGITHPEVIQHAGRISLDNVTLQPADLRAPKNSVPPPTPAAR